MGENVRRIVEAEEATPEAQLRGLKALARTMEAAGRRDALKAMRDALEEARERLSDAEQAIELAEKASPDMLLHYVRAYETTMRNLVTRPEYPTIRAMDAVSYRSMLQGIEASERVARGEAPTPDPGSTLD